MAYEFPLLLKRGQRIKVEDRAYTVHSIDQFIEEKWGTFHNRVGIETTVGTYLTVPIGSQVELTR